MTINRKKFRLEERGWIVDWIKPDGSLAASEGPYASRGDAEEAVGPEDVEPVFEPTWDDLMTESAAK
jgi:hypothetical protein